MMPDSALSSTRLGHCKKNPPNYNAFGIGGGNQNCATAVDAMLGAGGVSSGAILPDALVDSLSATHSSFSDYNGSIFGFDEPTGLGTQVPGLWGAGF